MAKLINFYDLSIICGLNIVWKSFHHLPVQSRFMAEMSQKRPAGFQFLDQAYGLGKREMCEMLAVTQCVDNQRIKSRQLLFLTFVDMLGIRHISESTDAVSEYRLLTMHYLYGHNFQSVDIERIIVDYTYIEFRDSGVRV